MLPTRFVKETLDQEDDMITSTIDRPPEVRRYNEDTGAPFYQDLLRILNQLNGERVRKGQSPITFREAVLEMGFKHDSITGKMKSGACVPANNRIEAAASFLGIDPKAFSIYVQRFAEERISRNRMLDIYRSMMDMNESQREVLEDAISTYVDKVITHIKEKVA